MWVWCLSPHADLGKSSDFSEDTSRSRSRIGSRVMSKFIPTVRNHRLAHEALVPALHVADKLVGDLDAASHVGRLFVDQINDTSSMITDIVTYERLPVLGKDWTLEIDSTTGRGMFPRASDTEHEFLLADAIMKKALYKDSAGTQVVVENGADGVAGTQTNLHALWSHFRDGEFALEVGKHVSSHQVQRVHFQYSP